MNKIGVVVIGLMTVVMGCKSKPQVEKPHVTYRFCVGVYTSAVTEGIHQIEFDSKQNQLTVQEVVLGSENPSFVTVNKNKTLLFAGEEIGGVKGGKVTAYQRNAKTQQYQKVSSAFTEGEHTCVIALDKSEKFLIAGNYSGGNIAVFPVDATGNIGNVVQVIQHYGKGTNPDRQEKSHIHDIVFHPNGKQILVTDLGTDHIYVYDFKPENPQPIEPSSVPFVKVKNGNGPRHVAFDASGNYFYAIQELTSEISTYRFDEDKITPLQTLSLHPKDKIILKGSGAEVKVSPNGKFVYATNRGDCNEINVFAIDLKTHLLIPIQTISSGGKTPRSFEITPDGKYLLVANQDSNTVVVFQIQSSGKLAPTNTQLTITKPTYIINN